MKSKPQLNYKDVREKISKMNRDARLSIQAYAYVYRHTHRRVTNEWNFQTKISSKNHFKLGITVPKPDSRIMDFFPKNLFDVAKYTQTKNMKNENFEFGAT